MTLGDIIKEYLKDGTVTELSNESGLSRAYIYLLMKNKSNSGGDIAPSVDTVKKVAKGVHMTFDEVISMLDENTMIRVNQPPGLSDEDEQVLNAYHAAPDQVKRLIKYLLAFEGGTDGESKIST